MTSVHFFNSTSAGAPSERLVKCGGIWSNKVSVLLAKTDIFLVALCKNLIAELEGTFSIAPELPNDSPKSRPQALTAPPPLDLARM